jgi:methylated-DNA-[protein]-cysteine S-methyltransferase
MDVGLGPRYIIVETPLGEFGLAGHEGGLCEVWLPAPNLQRLMKERYPGTGQAGESGFLADLSERLRAYATGELVTFDDIPLAINGTPFQMAVWRATRAIPRGQTRTYGQLAAEVGRPGAARAVGAAEGANPVPIVVPCHRVVGASGDLTGFGGGLALKRRLLELEQGPRLL